MDGYAKKAFMNVGGKPAKWNRRKKLFWLLAKRHRDGTNMTQIESEFSENGIELVPQLTACINTYATDGVSKYNLSLLFELARDWKTPEIYQFHRN